MATIANPRALYFLFTPPFLHTLFPMSYMSAEGVFLPPFLAVTWFSRRARPPQTPLRASAEVRRGRPSCPHWHEPPSSPSPSLPSLTRIAPCIAGLTLNVPHYTRSEPFCPSVLSYAPAHSHPPTHYLCFHNSAQQQQQQKWRRG